MHGSQRFPHHFPLRPLDRGAPTRELLAPEWQVSPVSFRQILYRFYDASRRPLYIGISGNGSTRLHDHRKVSAWWPQAEYIAISVYGTAADVQLAERAAIRAEQPRFNRYGLRGVQTAKVPLHGEPEEAAAVLFREATPDFIAALAALLTQPERFPQPAPPPPARFAEEEAP